jgi:transcriptional regulator GlxA family with amidase domain
MQEFGKMEASLPAARSEKLRRIHAWMESGIRTPPSLDEMAAHAAMSRRSFLRWFPSETGETPVAYLRRLRIREACRLLRFGNQSVDEIAEATGFANRYHFTRALHAQRARQSHRISARLCILALAGMYVHEVDAGMVHFHQYGSG